ncbi:hypothetical protein N7517_008308 [Penicillium concentricum]|uniref:Uncharacterized protein n=1 Tax=Penicillium concentricum TaxID=293559 RepID=A0A9W9RS59_9EURO|nr:uncharacterized protein N7517_008308 [Penicillium concentricum]KAJ5365422.1 hypothetical protein N7517_008308 [Penicillium concentricum]
MNSQAKPHAFIRSLAQQVADLEPDFPSPEDFQELGIQTFEVSLNPDKTELKFDPCFFQPHPENVVEKYPLHPEVDQEYRHNHLMIPHIRTIQDFINADPKRYPPELAPIPKNLTIWDRSLYEMENDAYGQAEDIAHVIDGHLSALRQGPSDYYTLQHLRNQGPWSPRHRAGDPPTMEVFGASRKAWRVEHHHRYVDRPLKPHSIMSCVAQIRPTDTNRGLTTHELRAIVNTLLLRVNHQPFRRCRVHPILVLSCLGDHQGRIIQASYDGKGLVLQYSQLWNFEDPENAPVELFVRYRLSEPIGGTYKLSLRQQYVLQPR